MTRTGPRSANSMAASVSFLALALALAGCGTVGGTSSPLARFSAVEERSPYGDYLAAVVAGYRRDTEAAALYYGRALESDPANAFIRERAFLLDVSAGNLARAAETGEAVLAKDPDNAVARVAVTIEALKRRNYARAAERIGAPIGSGGADIVWTSLKGWSLAGLGRFDEALALFSAKDSRAASGAFGLFQEALILDLAGRAIAADEAYAKTTIAFQGSSVRVLEAYGRFLERQGRAGDARRLYEAYLSNVPGHPVILEALGRASAPRPRAPGPFIADATEGAAEALLGIALALDDQNALDLPIVYAQMSNYLRPDHAVSMALLGDLFERAGQPREAIALFEKIPEASPLAPLAAIRIARNLSAAGEHEAAIAEMERLVRRSDPSADHWITLGDLYRIRERWVDAAAAYERALALSDTSGRNHWPILYSKGISLERAGRWSEAEAALKSALILSPDEPQVLNYLGYSWIDRGENLKAALGMIEKAVAQRPDDGHIVDSLGWAHFRLGDYEKAVAYLERAAELRASDPTINDHLGDAYWMVGRRNEARFQWNHALVGNPPPSEQDRLRIEEKLKNGLVLPPKPAERGAPASP